MWWFITNAKSTLKSQNGAFKVDEYISLGWHEIKYLTGIQVYNEELRRDVWRTRCVSRTHEMPRERDAVPVPHVQQIIRVALRPRSAPIQSQPVPKPGTQNSTQVSIPNQGPTTVPKWVVQTRYPKQYPSEYLKPRTQNCTQVSIPNQGPKTVTKWIVQT